MKHDSSNPADARQTALDRQVSALAAALREEGVAPARELWPEIAGAIEHLEAAGGSRSAAPGDRRGRRWATAALAATVLLMVGLGVTGPRRGPVGGLPSTAATVPGSADAPASTAAVPVDASGGPAATKLGLRAVEAALDELQTALRQSPDDPDLSRLVLMIHHSRGKLLRLQADGGSRGALRSGA